eukprot:g18760.t1
MKIKMSRTRTSDSVLVATAGPVGVLLFPSLTNSVGVRLWLPTALTGLLTLGGLGVAAHMMWQMKYAKNELLNPTFRHKNGQRMFYWHILVCVLHLFVAGSLAFVPLGSESDRPRPPIRLYVLSAFVLWTSSAQLARSFNRNTQSFGCVIGYWVVLRNVAELFLTSVAALRVAWVFYARPTDDAAACDAVRSLLLIHWWIWLYRLVDVLPRRLLRNTPGMTNWVVITVMYGVLASWCGIGELCQLKFFSATDREFDNSAIRLVPLRWFLQTVEGSMVGGEHSGSSVFTTVRDFPAPAGIRLEPFVFWAALAVSILFLIWNKAMLVGYQRDQTAALEARTPQRHAFERDYRKDYMARVQKTVGAQYLPAEKYASVKCPVHAIINGWNAFVSHTVDQKLLMAWFNTSLRFRDLLPWPLNLLVLAAERSQQRVENLIFVGGRMRPWWQTTSIEDRSAGTADKASRMKNGEKEALRRSVVEPPEDNVGEHELPPHHAFFGRFCASSFSAEKEHAKKYPLHYPDMGIIAERLLAREPENPAEAVGTGAFRPAGEQLNVLAAAWIQFQAHDWVDHKTKPYADEDGLVKIVSSAGVTELARTDFVPLRVPAAVANLRDDEKVPQAPPAFFQASVNTRPSAWNSSVVYGNTDVDMKKLCDFSTGYAVPEWRDKLLRDEVEKDQSEKDDFDAQVGGEPDDKKFELPRFSTDSQCVRYGDARNSHTGIELLQELFLREHNFIAAKIRRRHPTWSGERVFQSARLCVSAVIAKIHTIDWTVELLKTRTLRAAMRANWYGALGKTVKVSLTDKVGVGADSHVASVLSGLVGLPRPRQSSVSFGACPFQFSEEFSSVYRHLHSMSPDNLVMRRLDENDSAKKQQASKGSRSDVSDVELIPFLESCGGERSRRLMERYSRRELWSCMIAEPCGALVLGNYPSFLRQIETTDHLGNYEKTKASSKCPFKASGRGAGSSEEAAESSLPAAEAGEFRKLDLAVVDLFRDRERLGAMGRYNNFRRSLRLPALSSFGPKEPLLSHLSEPERKNIAEVYDNDVEAVDLLVGCLAENKPAGFAISETAFKVFILTASRRLETDPWFTQFFRKEYYSEVGLEHVEHHTECLRDVLKRHMPELERALGEDGRSAFAPTTVSV